MITFLIIFWWIGTWIFIGLLGYKIFVKAWVNDDAILVTSFFLAPIVFISSIFYYLLFRKNPPPINWYKWGDLIEYKGNKAIVVWRWNIIFVWESVIRDAYESDFSPIISWEMKDTLEYVNAVNEFQKATTELEEKANKVKSMRNKVKTIFDKQ